MREVPLEPVIRSGQIIKGANVQAGSSLGKVDYRLARNSLIRNFRNGRLSRVDVCDAHPELMRAALNVGDATSEQCPICEASNVVLVSYAFGKGLAPGGHHVRTRRELMKFASRSDAVTCYVVEVCPSCAWNHLARAFTVAGGRRTGVARRITGRRRASRTG